MNFLVLLLKILPWVGLGKKVVEETVEAIETKQAPDMNDIIETIETLPGAPTLGNDKEKKSA